MTDDKGREKCFTLEIPRPGWILPITHPAPDDFALISPARVSRATAILARQGQTCVRASLLPVASIKPVLRISPAIPRARATERKTNALRRDVWNIYTRVSGMFAKGEFAYIGATRKSFIFSLSFSCFRHLSPPSSSSPTLSFHGREHPEQSSFHGLSGSTQASTM